MEFALTKAERAKIEDLFTGYLFFHRLKSGGVECWCSRCREQYTVPPKSAGGKERQLLCNIQHNKPMVCPRCGRVSTAKNTGTAKSCASLAEEQRVVVIHRVSEKRVEAQSYVCWKSYWQGNYLCVTHIDQFRRYVLKPGEAVSYEWSYYFQKWNSKQKPVEPFRPKNAIGYCVQQDNSYHILGLEKLGNTFLRYHQLEQYAGNLRAGTCYDCYAMKYLCCFAQYPQLEMLQKLGYSGIVNDLVNRKRKGGRKFDWKAKTITGFFKMTKQEYREFEGALQSIRKEYAEELLTMRGMLNKLGYPNSMQKTATYWSLFGGLWNLKRGLDALKSISVPEREGLDYLLYQSKKAGVTFEQAKILFSDYRRIAKRLELGNSPEVLYPPHLNAAHDRAADLERAKLEEERQEREREKRKSEQETEKGYRKQHKKNLKQYAYEGAGFLIRVPETVQEIIDEGKAMHHCVGGYALRHMQGKLTILFLRSTEAPDKALYTIEMHDKRLTQVQGQGNRAPLTPAAKAFFDEWLSWVEAGSHRKKDGTPILQTKTHNLKGA